MTQSPISGSIVAISVDEDPLDLVEEDSIDYDAGESINDFELAAEAISESFHEVASPTLEFTATIDEDATGLENVGIIDDESGEVTTGGTREVENIEAEYIDGDTGDVEGRLTIPRGLVEWGGFDGQSPPTMDVTIHVQEQATYDTDPAAE